METRIVPQATRTWVSGVGDDVNPGSRTAPCKTFAGAISKTEAGGEIDALDPGGFGAVTITKSITLDGAKNLAGVLVAGTNGIVVNAAATDTVILRGLTFDGANLSGLNGIRILQAAVVDIENCVIENFSQVGIDFEPTNTAAQLVVKNTVIRACAAGGVLVQPGGTAASTGAAASASLDHVQSENNKFGFSCADNTSVSISNSLGSGNLTNGFVATSTTVSAHMNLQGDIASNNGNNGIKVSGANARLSITDVTATGNAGQGTRAVSSGVLFSFGNNRINDNNRGFTPLAIVAGIGGGGATRTWVSGVGDDANPGSRTAPCKTFAGAIAKTAAGGEIDALDPGGFGTITITRAITLDGSGSFGSILSAGVDGITVNAAATDTVILRGLSIDGAGSGLNGIRILQAGAVFIENCDIKNLTQVGIDFTPANAGCQLFVENTTVSNCAAGGVRIKPNAVNNTRAMIDNVFSQYNQFGFSVRDSADATISNSYAIGNKGQGFKVQAASASAVLNVEGGSATNNGDSGIMSQGASGNGAITATANLSRIVVAGNTGKGLNAIVANPATGFINSFGNIQVGDNLGGDGAPTGTLSQS